MKSDAKILLKGVIENRRRQLVTEIRAHTAGLNIGESEADPTDQVQSMISRDQSAGLVAGYQTRWRKWIDHLRHCLKAAMGSASSAMETSDWHG